MRAARMCIAGIVLVVVAGCGGAREHAGMPRPAAPEQAPAGFAPVRAASRERPAGRWLTAQLRQPVTLRAHPGGTGRGLARLRARTEFGSARVLGVLARRGGWLRVVSPAL